MNTPKLFVSNVAALGLALTFAAPTPASAEPVGRCIEEVSPYRSLVIHKADDNGRSITLPDQTAFDLQSDQAIIDTNFWEDPLDPLAGFSMERTLRNLVVTDPLAPDALTEVEITARMDNLAQSWLDTLSPDDQFLPAGGGLEVLLDGRQGESDLLIADVYAMEPVALFNRVDARDALGFTCGEHRIVYQLGSGNFARLLLIFEARIANPHFDRGPAGCLPIAKHWAEASDLEGEELAAHLETLFYEGISDFDPAIHFTHLGAPFGQVRGNCFLTPNWQLREWHIDNQPATASGSMGDPIFRVETVKGNALAELYMTEDGEGVPSNVQASNLDWAAVLNDFQVAYGEGTVPHTLRPESEGLSPEDGSGVGFVSAITAPIDSEFLEYQATSQSGGEIITDQLSLELADRISCWLEGRDAGVCDLSAPIPGTAGITVEHVIERTKRAGTCDGCHKVGPVAEVAPGILWPQDQGFTHVTTEGSLSDALHGTFLPPRAVGIVDMINNAPVGDTNLDGVVNINDLLNIFSTYGEPNDEFDQDCNGAINVMDLLAVVGAFNSASSAAGRTAASPNLKLKSAIGRWHQTDAKSRALVLKDIARERARLRALEAAQLSPEGFPRRTH